MKKIIYYGLCLLIGMVFITGCKINLQEKKNNQKKEEINNSNKVRNNMKISINEKEYNIVLEDNKTVEELIKELPHEFIMNDLNQNEKYIYLDHSISTSSENPKIIHKGDVMLYGDNCFVIFYQTFKTSYSYTKIGYIPNLDELDN